MTAGADTELTCHDLVELVTAYLDGALPAADRARLERHLAECRGCRAYLDQLAGVMRAAGLLSERSIPGEAREALLRAFSAWKRGRDVV